MAVQDKILTKNAPTITLPGSKSFTGQLGTLAIGKPGDVTSIAFGPVVKTDTVATSGGEEFGTYVTGKGVVVNSNDVANKSNYAQNFKAEKGQTVGYMTYGTCVMWTKSLAGLTSDASDANKMKYRVLANESTVTKDAGAGITAITPTWSTFASKVKVMDGDDVKSYGEGTYVFKATVTGSEPATTTWKIGDTTVNLADYGITVTGTVANNDQFTVEFYALCDVELTGFKG